MDHNFGIQVTERDHTLIVQVSGELDLSTAPLLEERLSSAEARDAVRVLVDLDQLEFMDSSGLQALLRHVVMNGDGKRYSLTRGSPQVQRLFKAAGVLDRLPFAPE